MGLSPTFTLLTIILSILFFCTLIHPTDADLSKEDKAEMEKIIEEQLQKRFGNKTKEFGYMNTTMALAEAFRQSTGHEFTGVVIIIVLVLTIPSLLINVAFLMCQFAVKSGVQVACCGLKCGAKAVCCCCGICGRVLCPRCCNGSGAATDGGKTQSSGGEA